MLLAVTLTAAAHAGDGTAELADEASRLVSMPYAAFERAARDRAAPFDWTTDGCSRTPQRLAARFDGPCRQHDFAYRNLGRGLRLRPTEAARRWADERFHDELRRRCAELFAGLRLTRCRVTARGMWAAVRRLGPRWSGPQGRSSGSAGAVTRGACSAGGLAASLRWSVGLAGSELALLERALLRNRVENTQQLSHPADEQALLVDLDPHAR